MGTDRAVRKEQAVGDLAVGKAGCRHLRDLQLLRRERLWRFRGRFGVPFAGGSQLGSGFVRPGLQSQRVERVPRLPQMRS